MRILHWFNQNGAPLDDGNGYPTATGLKAAQTWAFHNALLRTSSRKLILTAEDEVGSGQLFNDGVIALKPGWTNDATSVGSGGIGEVAIPFPTPPGGKQATIVIGNQINSAFSGGPNPDLAQNFIEDVWTQVDAQEFLTKNCAIWIPALKSILQQYATYNNLDKFGNDTAKAMVRVTMKAALDGGAGPISTWPANGSQCWLDWNNFFGFIYEVNPPLYQIQSELNHLQWQLLWDSLQQSNTSLTSYWDFLPQMSR